MKTLTVIAPVYNEAEVIRDFYQAVARELSGLRGYHSTILFVLDRSADGTLGILKTIAAGDPVVRVLALSSRFGHQLSLRAGLDHADSDAVIMMDSDLQHPPELIPTLVAEYEKGADVVYTVRTDTVQISGIKRLFSRMFYWFFDRISEVPIQSGVADFRLVSRRVANVIKERIHERNLFLRGLMPWIGFTQVAVSYVARERRAGRSKYSLRRMVQLAMFGVIAFSKKPIRLALLAGIVLAAAGCMGALIIVFRYFFIEQAVSGAATVISVALFLSGVQLAFLGIIGEYIGGIFDEVKQRPHYIVEEKINF